MDLSEFLGGMLAIALGLVHLALEIRLFLKLSRIEKWLAAHPLEPEADIRHSDKHRDHQKGNRRSFPPVTPWEEQPEFIKNKN